MKQKINLKERIRAANDALARENAALLSRHDLLGINLMSSPGAGKTTLIEATARGLAGRIRLGVIEGDLAGSLDRDRLLAAGVPAVQINTGRGCHLNAQMVAEVLEELKKRSSETISSSSLWTKRP